MQMIYLLLLLAPWGMTLADSPTENPTDVTLPDFVDEEKITSATEKCITDATEIEAKRACYAQCTNSVVSTMATKICLAIGGDVEKAYLEQIYQQALTYLKTELGKATTDYDTSYNKELIRRLNKSQKAFNSTLPTFCEFESADFLFGTGEGVLYLDCLSSKTKSRSNDIKNLIFPN